MLNDLSIHLSRLLVIVLIVTAISYQPARTRAFSLPGGELPADLRLEQIFPDISFGNGYTEPAATGDFNGDGLDDFLVSYPGPQGEFGSLVPFKFGIFFGKRQQQMISFDLIIDEPELALNTSAKPGEAYITSLGDLNSDGIDDIALRQQSTGGDLIIKIFYGSRKFKPGAIDIDARAPDLKIIAPATVWIFTADVVGAADTNGDGVKDILLVENRFDALSTAAVLLGPFARGATVDLRSQQPDVAIQFSGQIYKGTFLADVNGDHLADVLLKRAKTESETGRTFNTVDVIFGSAGWKSGSTIAADTQADAVFYLGYDPENGSNWTVIQPGDVNGDGIDDVLVGIPRVLSLAPPSWFSGSVSIFFGSRQLHGSVDTPDVVIAGLPIPSPFRPANQIMLGDHLGEAVAVGDVNGDGLPDIVVGAPGENTDEIGRIINTGRAYIIIGSAEMKSGTQIETARYQQDVTITAGENALLGWRLLIGDYNGDGFDDIGIAYWSSLLVYFGGPLRAPEITDAGYNGAAAELVIRGHDFTGSTQVKINGVQMTGEVTFNHEEGTLVLPGTKDELNLHDGKNKISVRGKGARSNTFKLKLT